MSRPHRRRDLSGHELRRRLGALPPAEAAPGLQALNTAVQQLARTCARCPALLRPLSTTERQQLRGRWAAHVPQLARRLAPLLDREAEVLAPLGLQGAELLAQEQQVRQLWAIKHTLERLLQRVADALLLGRAALYSDVQRTLSAVAVLTRGPLARPEVAARLETVSAPARALVAARQAQLARRRQQLRALRQAATTPTGPTPPDDPPRTGRHEPPTPLQSGRHLADAQVRGGHDVIICRCRSNHSRAMPAPLHRSAPGLDGRADPAPRTAGAAAHPEPAPADSPGGFG
ncbi:MAG: hypothetical protein RMK29_09110 [Myxococcales bacterium]|nr:hypothetical protein [Myxococcales bacterium]